MQRNKGKVPTRVNKNEVATGDVQSKTQIIDAGSKTPKNWVSLNPKIEERVKQEKLQKSLNPENIKMKQAEITKVTKQQKPKEFTKRIDDERSK